MSSYVCKLIGVAWVKLHWYQQLHKYLRDKKIKPSDKNYYQEKQKGRYTIRVLYTTIKGSSYIRVLLYMWLHTRQLHTNSDCLLNICRCGGLWISMKDDLARCLHMHAFCVCVCVCVCVSVCSPARVADASHSPQSAGHSSTWCRFWVAPEHVSDIEQNPSPHDPVLPYNCMINRLINKYLVD